VQNNECSCLFILGIMSPQWKPVLNSTFRKNGHACVPESSLVFLSSAPSLLALRASKENPCMALFHGILAKSMVMPQVPVSPANASPAPANTVSQIRVGVMCNEPIAPAAICTCRRIGKTFLVLVTGSFVSCHAKNPPSTFTRVVYPSSCKRVNAFPERFPVQQMG